MYTKINVLLLYTTMANKRKHELETPHGLEPPDDLTLPNTLRIHGKQYERVKNARGEDLKDAKGNQMYTIEEFTYEPRQHLSGWNQYTKGNRGGVINYSKAAKIKLLIEPVTEPGLRKPGSDLFAILFKTSSTKISKDYNLYGEKNSDHAFTKLKELFYSKLSHETKREFGGNSGDTSMIIVPRQVAMSYNDLEEFRNPDLAEIINERMCRVLFVDVGKKTAQSLSASHHSPSASHHSPFKKRKTGKKGGSSRFTRKTKRRR